MGALAQSLRAGLLSPCLPRRNLPHRGDAKDGSPAPPHRDVLVKPQRVHGPQQVVAVDGLAPLPLALVARSAHAGKGPRPWQWMPGSAQARPHMHLVYACGPAWRCPRHALATPPRLVLPKGGAPAPRSAAAPAPPHSLVMKEMNSDRHSCTVSLASFAILALPGSARFMMRLMLAMGSSRSWSLRGRVREGVLWERALLGCSSWPWAQLRLRVATECARDALCSCKCTGALLWPGQCLQKAATQLAAARLWAGGWKRSSRRCRPGGRARHCQPFSCPSRLAQPSPELRSRQRAQRPSHLTAPSLSSPLFSALIAILLCLALKLVSTAGMLGRRVWKQMGLGLTWTAGGERSGTLQ